MEENPNVNIEIQAVSSNDIYTNLAAMATSPDDLPTLFFTSADQAPTLYDLGLMEDLKGYLDDETLGAFANGVVDACTYDDTMAFYPIDVQPLAMLYRTDRFEEKGLEVPKAELEVTEEEIAGELRKEQEENSRVLDVDDRAVADGDKVTLDFEGFVDGEAFDGGKGTDYPLTIGSGSFIPGFEEQLVGANIGEEKEVNVTFPEDYQAAELAGKPAVFKCTVKKIEVKELPELDDEFAKDVSEFDTLEEYKADIKKNLEEKKADAAKRAKEDAAVDTAVANATMEIPDAMLDTQVNQMIDDFARRMQSQGLTMDQYMQFTGTTLASLQEQMKPQALKRIQTRLVLEKIAEAEAIEIADEKIDEEINKMAEMYKMEADKLKEMLGDAEKEQMKKDMAVQEAVTILADAAKEVEKTEE